jgi:release factor glutamine methyltransferase
LLSLLQELPQATGVGVDISADAIQTAGQNAKTLDLSQRATFTLSDWENMAVGQPFDVVISNPPYIATAEIAKLEPEVRQYDPHLALAGGADGLDCYRSIAKLLPRFLTQQGRVFLEIGHDQAGAVKGILAVEGFRVLQVVPDLAGHSRCVVAQRLSQD